MRTLMLLSAMLLVLATSNGLAQSRGSAAADAAQAAPAPDAAAPKSAFGRVMAVMIAKLVQDSRQAAQARASDSSGTTLPIEVEVGAAFQPAASGTATAAARTLPDATSATPGDDAPARAPELALRATPLVAGQ